MSEQVRKLLEQVKKDLEETNNVAVFRLHNSKNIFGDDSAEVRAINWALADSMFKLQTAINLLDKQE